MGNAGRQTANRLHFLRFAELLFEAASLGHIDCDDHASGLVAGWVSEHRCAERDDPL